MAFLFKDILEKVAKYSGKQCHTEHANSFTQRVIERAIERNGAETAGHWCLLACDECFTAPRDLNKIHHVKIGGKVTRIWDYHYQYYDQVYDGNYTYYSGGIHRMAGNYPVIYDPPYGDRPFRIAVESEVSELNCNAVLVQGQDCDNKEIYSHQDNINYRGEKMPICRSDQELIVSYHQFTKINGIQKDETNSIIKVLYVYEEHNCEPETFIAAELLPNERRSNYTRYRLPQLNQKGCCVELSLLGSIAVKMNYHMYDEVPVTSMDLLIEIAQEIEAGDEGNINRERAKKATVKERIMEKNKHKQEGIRHLNVARLLTAGGDRIIGGRKWRNKKW